jgi:hypothetical protein
MEILLNAASLTCRALGASANPSTDDDSSDAANTKQTTIPANKEFREVIMSID